jgi:hypothetical protein
MAGEKKMFWKATISNKHTGDVQQAAEKMEWDLEQDALLVIFLTAMLDCR